MRPTLALFLLLLASFLSAAEPEFPLTEDSKPHANVPKGTLIKETYTTKEGSVFPGTQREYQIYLPAGHDATKPAAFMVFQDGVIYQAPVAFDNLIAKKDIPPLVGIFIKPGVVPAANENALPRFNRSYEYDSVTDTYAKFLIDEFLPAIEARHKLTLSKDPNHAAISGNSSGGICAFMVAWHRPDRFRRVFTGVGTYVGIHGADQLPVFVRKFEPRPIRVFLQSGTGDNNLYCGDWWMANQMMERSLAWAGYEVNHAWGEGGHNGKHATQIFPDVLRWLWKDWQTNIEVKANAKGEGKWRGYEVLIASAADAPEVENQGWTVVDSHRATGCHRLAPNAKGEVVAINGERMHKIGLDGESTPIGQGITRPLAAAWGPDNTLYVACAGTKKPTRVAALAEDGRVTTVAVPFAGAVQSLAVASTGDIYFTETGSGISRVNRKGIDGWTQSEGEWSDPGCDFITLSPDQTLILGTSEHGFSTPSFQIRKDSDSRAAGGQHYFLLDRWPATDFTAGGLCVDTDGRMYVATSLGIQVCDQAGRVNFIIPTPQHAYDVCFGGQDLSELFIACGDKVYKRPTKAKGVVSGQQAPIKPAPPKL